MNSMVPRFQSGGFVGAPRQNMTDTGYKDYKGRPVLLSAPAAEGFKCMIDKGMKYNPADVVNVFRDKAEYNRLLNSGASPAKASKHNFGEAIDAHGSVGHFIRTKGKDCGWGAHDYAGTHGGHYEFQPGTGPQRDESYANQGQTQPGGIKGVSANEPSMVEKAIGGMFNITGGVADAVGGAAQTGARDAGLPGLADYMEIFGQGFKQSGFGEEMERVMKGVGTFTQSFLGAIGGAFGGLLPGLGGGGDKEESKGGFGGPISALTRNMMGGLTGQPAGAAEQPGGSGAMPSMPALSGTGDKKDRAILDMIASVEAAQGDPYGGFNTSRGGTPGRAVDKTIDWLARNAQGAIGRYQHMPQFLRDRAIAAGYDPATTKFTPKVQDALTLHFLDQDTGGMYGQWKQGKVGHAPMGDQLSRIWRGLPHSSGGTYPDQYAGGNKAHMSRGAMINRMKEIQGLQRGGIVGFQQGGVANMTGSSANHMKRYEKAMEMFQARTAVSSEPVIIPVPMGGGKGGGGNTSVTGSMGTPAPPELPAGPQVVALLELQNRLALGAAI